MNRSLTISWQDPRTLADAGRLEDASGKLYTHATTTCMVLANN